MAPQPQSSEDPENQPDPRPFARRSNRRCSRPSREAHGPTDALDAPQRQVRVQVWNGKVINENGADQETAGFRFREFDLTRRGKCHESLLLSPVGPERHVDLIRDHSGDWRQILGG